MEQHLKQMFPAAFAEDAAMAPDDVELQADMANKSDRNDVDVGSFVLTPPQSCMPHRDDDDDDELNIGSNATASAMDNGRKRKKCDSDAMTKPPTKRAIPNNANEKVVMIDSDDDEDSDRPSTSSQKRNKNPPAAKKDTQFISILREYAEISGQIALNEQKKSELQAQQATLTAKLQNYNK